MTHFHEQYEEVSRKLEEVLNAPNLFVFGRVDVWLKQGALPEEILEICPRVAKQGRWSGRSLNYFDGFIADAIAARTKPMPEAKPRADRGGFERKREGGYEPTPELPPETRAAIERRHCEMIEKGMTVMSVTPADARRFFKNGWLSEAGARRCGVSLSDISGLNQQEAV